MRLLLIVLALSACGGDSSTDPPTAAAAAENPPPGLPCAGWQPQVSGSDASFRGLSAFDREVVWVSGTGGTWGRTTDGGETWSLGTVAGADELDFRDVDAVGRDTAYLMSAGPGELSRIYKTTDGGRSWELRHTNPWPEGFFDGMAFWDAERGIVYGDPDGRTPDGRRFLVLTTADGGATWNRVPAASLPPARDGEAGFAASGSGLAVVAGGAVWLGTGGGAARVFHSADYGQTWTVAATPMAAGSSSAGIFSLAFGDRLHGVAVGGDYTLPEATAGNAARTVDGGHTWSPVAAPPAGYRSAVAWVAGAEGPVLVTVGTSGSDFSADGGESWSPLGAEGYHTLGVAEGTCAAWAAGAEGRIARLGRQEATPGV